MKTYIALLRGINVSGQKKIKMADLKSLFESLDFKNVKTYIQSGNVIFDMDEMPTEHLEQAIEYRLQKTYGFDVTTIVTNPTDLQHIVHNSPYINDASVDVNRLFVCFLKTAPEPDAMDKLNNITLEEEYFHVFDNVVYIHVPHGIGRAKLNNNFIENKLKVVATTRNWKTINKLIELSKGE